VYENRVRSEFADREYGEYFGNEASSTTFYTKVALLVDVPAADKREQELELGTDGLTSAMLQPKVAAVDPAAEPSKPNNTAPPKLFVEKASSAALNCVRSINVTGGQGNTKCEQAGGKCTIVLAPKEGLKELKAKIRQAFGKAQYKRMGSLMLGERPSASGQNADRQAKANDLVDGATVRCQYSHAPGNPGNLPMHRGGRGGGFGIGGLQSHIMMMQMMGGGGPFGYPATGSDDGY